MVSIKQATENAMAFADFVTAAALLGSPKREYKTFTVLKRDGEVTSMKIRELADA